MVINAEYVRSCCFNALARSADGATAKKKKNQKVHQSYNSKARQCFTTVNHIAISVFRMKSWKHEPKNPKNYLNN